MASSLKRPRLHEFSEAGEEDDELVKLVHRRVGDVKKLVTDIKKKEIELAEAEAKLDHAVAMLDQIRDKNGDQNRPAFRHRESVSNGANGQTDGLENALASASPAKRVAIVSKTAAGSSAVRPVSTREQPKQSAVGESPAKRSQDKRSKKSSGGETKLNKTKGVVQREHIDLIAKIRSQGKPKKMDVASPSYIPLQHKRKPRSLVLSPAIDHLCATSALDGVVNFWQITQDKGFGVNLSHTVDCISPGQRRWPEDMAWHPLGETLFAVYTADGGGPQIGIINTSKKKPGVKFLDDKPHQKGIVNSIQFLPWSNGSQLVTGGCDHGVVLWTENDEGWRSRLLHRFHSSAVSGVGGMLSKKYIMSSGMDKRVFAVDPNSSHGRPTFQHQLDSKALGVAPNPADYNLVMIQTGSPGKQLRLFDIRVQSTELHCFGWKQQAGNSQSGYISQSWSPDGLYAVSGSTDPKIHVFDIRYNSEEPVQSLDAHQKRVFKAAWHPNLPLMMSISSDLFIGMHKIFG